jgi:trehalose/maltose hydrolase-like predicted phosphorylase
MKVPIKRFEKILAWRSFAEIIELDSRDIWSVRPPDSVLKAAWVAHPDRYGNSAGGVRIAGLGALWQAVMLGFAGLDLRGDMLGIDPMLPPQWRSLSFRVCWRGRSVGIRIAGKSVEAKLVDGEPMEMRIAATTRKLTEGATLQVSL